MSCNDHELYYRFYVLSLTTQYVIINCDIGEYWNFDFHVLLCVYAWMKEWDIDMFHHVLLTQPKS